MSSWLKTESLTMKCQDKVALVTGAGGGIGRAIALRLAQEGTAVVASDIRLDTAQKTVEAIEQNGGQALAVEADVADRSAVVQMVKTVCDRYGKIDILVNNAGGSAALLNKLSFFHESDEQTVDWVIRLNLKGVLVCIRAVINHMIENRYGKIINVASIAGSVGITQRVDYAAAKGGVIALTKALAMEVGTYGINVNCVSPGAVSPNSDQCREMTYLPRSGRAADIAGMVAFLASDDADFITGQDYIVDGGRVLGPKTQKVNEA
jgi:NAD(P)-dependent dehydrogenase (short-subunit alcohol dehydrogenase family)